MESGVISTLGCYLNKYGSGEATMESPLLIAQIISQGQTNFVKEIASMIFFQIIGVSIKLSSYGSGGAVTLILNVNGSLRDLITFFF